MIQRIRFATEIFLRIIFKRNYFATNMNRYCHSDMTINQANNIIHTIKNEIDETMNPINLMNEVNDILNKPPTFNN